MEKKMRGKKASVLFFLFLAFFFSLKVFADVEEGQARSDLKHKILEDNFKVTAPFKRIFYSLGVSCESDLKNVVELTQKKWIKSNEKKQLGEIDRRKGDFIYQLKELGCVDKILPSKKSYDYCLLIGGAYPTFIERLDYIIDRWEQGVRFNTLIFVAEERLLDFEREKRLLLNNPNKQIKSKASQKLPQTEIDMIKFVFENIDLPKELRDVKTLFLSSQGTITPFRFSDSLIRWTIEKRPPRGSCLVVSSQPYVGYEESCVRSALPNFEIEAIGEAASPNTKVSEYFEILAMWLYNEALTNNLLDPQTKEVFGEKASGFRLR